MPGKILICDDELPIRAVLGMKFRAAGYEVRECDNGIDGLADALAHKPDMIVTDLQMPGGDGLTMAESLSANEATKSVPVIMLTARGHIIDEFRLTRTNVVRMLDKPFSARAVVEAVSNILAGKQEAA